jgi:hypothetical protein
MLDGAGGLRGDVVGDAIDAADFIDDAVRDPAQELHVEVEEVGGPAARRSSLPGLDRDLGDPARSAPGEAVGAGLALEVGGTRLRVAGSTPSRQLTLTTA